MNTSKKVGQHFYKGAVFNYEKRLMMDQGRVNDPDLWYYDPGKIPVGGPVLI